MLTPTQQRELVEQYRHLPAHVAHRVFRQIEKGNARFTFDDLVQAGQIGLIRAARNFDPDMGTKFITYAWHAVWDKAVKEIGHSYLICVPQHIQMAVRRAWKELPTDVDPDYLAAGQRAMGLMPGEHNEAILRELPAPYRDPHAHDDFHAALDRLRPEDRELLAQRFGLHDAPAMTLEEIGQRQGRTRERIRQKEDIALGRLCKEMRRTAA